MTQNLPSSKLELFQRFRDEYTACLNIMNQVKPQGRQHEIAGNWSIFDILKHLAGWAVWRVDALEEYLKQGFVQDYPFVMNGKFNSVMQDEFNSTIVAERAEYTWDQIVTEIVNSDEKWIKLLDGLSEDEIFVSTKYKSPGWNTLSQWVKVAYDHYSHHFNIVKAAIH